MMIGDRFSDTKEIDGSFDAGSPHVHARQLVDQGELSRTRSALVADNLRSPLLQSRPYRVFDLRE